jgi:glycosyltransferase involved in cell wall biosynthesis
MFNDPATWELGDVNRPRNPILGLLKNVIMYPQEKKLLREIDQVTVLDTRVQTILQEFYGIEARVVRTGLDHLRFRVKNENNLLRAKYDIPSSALLALWVGVLFPHRRLEDLIQSVRVLRDRNHDVRALIVGSASQAPEYFADLQNLVTELALQGRVLFVPANVSEEQLVEYYQSTDVFVFPNDLQTWGLAPLEAMACGKPVVVSKGSGVHEVLRDHETALLVPPRNPAAIAAALEQLILDPGLRHQLSQAGYHFVQDTLSWEKYARQMAEIFEIAANHRQSSHFAKPPRQQKREARACL